MTTTISTVPDTATKLTGIRKFRREQGGLIGRDTEMYVVQVALAAKLHIILHGEPGVAKSMTVDSLLRHMPHLSKFKTQAYKASPPEQFLGPISFKGMEQDKFVRIIARKVADVNVAVLDELPRAPRAVLPAFQGMMVEREFDAGDGVQPVPLHSLIGTSNHLPTDEELAAFLDRFALKLVVKAPASQQQFVEILKGALRRREQGEPAIPDELIVTEREWIEFQEHVTRVHVPDDILERFGELWSNLLAAGIKPSIRRYVDTTAAMQAVAALDGRDECAQDDLQIALHAMWTQEEEIQTVYEHVIGLASEWMKEKATLVDSFAEILDRLGQVQALLAAGSETREQVQIGDQTDSITQHSINVLDAYKKLRPLVERHIAAATGQDTTELETTLAQMDGGKRWISERIMGGLDL